MQVTTDDGTDAIGANEYAAFDPPAIGQPVPRPDAESRALKAAGDRGRGDTGPAQGGKGMRRGGEREARLGGTAGRCEDPAAPATAPKRGGGGQPADARADNQCRLSD